MCMNTAQRGSLWERAGVVQPEFQTLTANLKLQKTDVGQKALQITAEKLKPQYLPESLLPSKKDSQKP